MCKFEFTSLAIYPNNLRTRLDDMFILIVESIWNILSFIKNHRLVPSLVKLVEKGHLIHKVLPILHNLRIWIKQNFRVHVLDNIVVLWLLEVKFTQPFGFCKLFAPIPIFQLPDLLLTDCLLITLIIFPVRKFRVIKTTIRL
jgi:hypothetical protein